MISCASSVDVYKIKKQPEDTYSEKENDSLRVLNLIAQKRKKILFSLRSFNGDEKQKETYNELNAKYVRTFGKFTNYETHIEEKYNRDDFRPIEFNSEEILLNYDFIAFLELRFFKFRPTLEKTDYQSQIKVQFYQVYNQKLITVHDLLVESEEMNKMEGNIKDITSFYFPLKAFVQESRGGRQVVKINIGAASGVKLGGQFHFRDVLFNQELKDQNDQNYLSSLVISYSEDVKGNGKVVFVEEDSAWIEVDEEYRSEIHVSMAAFMDIKN